MTEKFLFSVNEGGRSVTFIVWVLPGSRQKEQVITLGLAAYANFKKKNGYIRQKDFSVKKLSFNTNESPRRPCAFNNEGEYALPQPGERKYRMRSLN